MLGSLISAGAQLAGGLFGMSSAKDAREQANAHSLRQEALQREFAQNGITWKVRDAQRAGIHPIYALGSSGASYTPTAQAFTADTSMPAAMAAAGQDIGRAVNATRSGTQRLDAFTRTAQALQLEKAGLENEVLRMEIASKAGRIRQENAPAMPIGDNYLIPGQAGSLTVKNKALERVQSAPGAPQQEHGAIPDVGFARTKTGYAPVPSADVKQRIEDNLIQEVMWSIRNNIMPSLGMYDPPKFDPGQDRKWIYNPLRQEYQSWQKPFRRTRGGGSGW